MPGALSLCRHNGLRLSYTGSCRTLSITCLSSFFQFFCHRPSQSGYCIIPAGPIPIPGTRSSEERHPVTFQVSLYPQQNLSLAFDSTQSQPSHSTLCIAMLVLPPSGSFCKHENKCDRGVLSLFDVYCQIIIWQSWSMKYMVPFSINFLPKG